MMSEDREGTLYGTAADDERRLRAKLKVIKTELTRRMHGPISKMTARLCSVFLGHFRRYGVPLNYRALEADMSGVFRLSLSLTGIVVAPASAAG